MHLILPLLLFFALILGPSLWVRFTIQRYHLDSKRFEGTGAQLVEHLAKNLNLGPVSVVKAPSDFYDPIEGVIGLKEENYNGQSLSAIVIAAHETGHWIQHRADSPLFAFRLKLAKGADSLAKVGSMAILVAPLLGLVTKSPLIAMMMIAVGVSSALFDVLMHLLTLPVEIDASFNKAMVLLKQGGIIDPEDEEGCQRILWACAITYVAASLKSLLHLGRWLRILRR